MANWAALGASLVGAALGAVAGGVVMLAREKRTEAKASHERKLGTALLVGGSLGAIVGAAFSPTANKPAA